jgi:ankyrin repeat protein
MTNNQGNTPLHEALFAGAEEVAQRIKDSGLVVEEIANNEGVTIQMLQRPLKKRSIEEMQEELLKLEQNQLNIN